MVETHPINRYLEFGFSIVQVSATKSDSWNTGGYSNLPLHCDLTGFRLGELAALVTEKCWEWAEITYNFHLIIVIAIETKYRHNDTDRRQTQMFQCCRHVGHTGFQ